MTIDVFKIPKGEMDILHILWDALKPMTGEQISLALRDRFQRRIKPSTLHTLAGRLVKKRMIVFVQVNGCNLYMPICSKVEYMAFAARQFLSVLYHGSVAEMVLSLMVEGSIDREDWDALKEMTEAAMGAYGDGIEAVPEGAENAEEASEKMAEATPSASEGLREEAVSATAKTPKRKRSSNLPRAA